MNKHRMLWSKMRGKIRAMLIGLCLLATTTAQAEEAKWLLVTDSGTKLEMENVGSFVFSGTDAFDILDKSGTVIAPSVKKVSFEYFKSTGIQNTKGTKETSLLSFTVDSQLTIVGSMSDTQVYTASGVLVASGKSKDGTTVIDVSHLSQGIYLVRSGNQSFKFVKK